MLGRWFAAAAFLLLLCGAARAEGIAYLDTDGTEKSCAAYTEVTSSTEKWTAGWYAVTGEVTVKKRIRVESEVHLILVNGAKLHAKHGIRVEGDNSLTIYAQTTDEAQMGELVATGHSNQFNAHAGIGSNEKHDAGTITIAGGRVTAKGASNMTLGSTTYGAAGIGGGDEGDCGKEIITGGVVTATGGHGDVGGGAGIGGGNEGNGGEVTIYGGKVTATGGKYGAGIGGGDNGDNGTTIIHGGIVKATGGAFAAGIGCSEDGDGGTVTITGGEVEATGSIQLAAGIGGGEDGNGAVVTISGGRVTAVGSECAAGIGGGSMGDGNVITISGGEVKATGGFHAAGIGGGDYSHGGTITISGGRVTAVAGGSAAGIGGGYFGEVGFVSITGGEVTATGGSGGYCGPGIGNAALHSSPGGLVKITGGTVTAVGGEVTTHHSGGSWSGGAGIGGGYAAYSCDVKIMGGTVTAIGRERAPGIGYCFLGERGDVIISRGTVTADGQTAAVTCEQFYLCPPSGQVMTIRDAQHKDVPYERKPNHNEVETFSGYKKLTFQAPESPLGAVPYLNVLQEQETCVDYTLVDRDRPSWKSGWYVLDCDMPFDSRIEVKGDVHLILCNGVALDAKQGIRVEGDNALTIYAQTTDEQRMGALTATGKSNQSNAHAGIGSNEKKKSGTITIAGGRVTAKGASNKTGTEKTYGAAGIGGGDEGDCGKVTITGGVVTATGGEGDLGGGAGIGGGNEGKGGEVTIHGGRVTAKGGKWGAGIGGGDNAKNGEVTITGGVVTATGGANAAGIGGGDKAVGGKVTIDGGEVTARGGALFRDDIGASGIGAGRGKRDGTLIISGGKLVASAMNSALRCTQLSISPKEGRTIFVRGDEDQEVEYPPSDNYAEFLTPYRKLTFVASDYGREESGLLGVSKPQVQGGGQTVVSGQSAAFSSSIPWQRVQDVTVKVYVNHRCVDPKHYTVTIEGKASRARSAGGTVRIILHEDYLATLPAGRYSFFAAMDGTDGRYAAIQTGFTVAGDPELPQTGDDSHLALWCALLALCAAGFWAFRRRAA